MEKFNSKGEKVAFTAPSAYVNKAEITGRPAGDGCGELFGFQGPSAVTVDAAGDVYLAVPECGRVFEYEPSGGYVREFDLGGSGVPRLGQEGNIGSPVGMAFDPVSRHLLVIASISLNPDEPEEYGALDEFEAEGPDAGKFVAQIKSTPQGELERPVGVAVDSTGVVYVTDAERKAVDVFSRGAYDPTVTLGATTGRTSTAAVLNGSVDPAQAENVQRAPVTECYFQYVEESVYTKALAGDEEGGFPKANPKVREAPCEHPEIPVEPERQDPVHAAIGPLTPGETYRYRLVATTEPAKNGGTSASEEVFAFTAPAPSAILATSAQNISSTFADLQAQINPLGAATSYRFEYDTRAYGAGEAGHGVSVPVPDAAIGAGGPTGSSVESVLQHVGPLIPGTTYYFRVVATNSQGTTMGGVCEGEAGLQADCTFATLAGAAGGERGYELVTPADRKGGSDMFSESDVNGTIENQHDLGTPSESGEGFILNTESSFGEFPFAFGQIDVFSREPAKGRWSYTSLASPSLGTQTGRGFALTEPFAFGKVAFSDNLGSLGAEGVRVTSLIGPPGGPYVNLHEDAPYHNATEEKSQTIFVGGSRDLSHVLLSSPYPSTCPGAGNAAGKVTHGEVLCEWSGGEPQLVDVAPGNEFEPTSECGARLGSVDANGGDGGLAHNAVSEDGSRVFFTAPGPEDREKGPGCWNGNAEEKGAKPLDAPQLYARVAHEESGEVTHTTFDVSEPEAAVRKEEPLRYPAIYLGASTDGNKVFFQTRTWMTVNHPKGHDSELYECEIEEVEGTPGCKLTRISAGEAGSEGEHAGARVLFVPAVSADGSTVYFTAAGVLATGGTNYPTVGQAVASGPINLYRYDTVNDSTSYVATVDTLDFSNETECRTSIQAEAGVTSEYTVPCALANWYATPDGGFLVFGASLPVAGYNKTAAGCAEQTLPSTQAGSDGRCTEIYRYDAGAAERGERAVVCVSCGSSEADAAGNAEIARSGSNGPDSTVPRAMSTNGEYVFFDSQAALVPEATNHTLDTYQWHAGRLSLIGSGADPAPTFFLGYSPNPAAHSEAAREGGNVFIGTHANLIPTERTESQGNIFDARVCEPDSPCIEPPTGETAQCEGGSCQKPPPAPPDPVATLLAPPSAATLTGPPPATKVTKKTTPKCRQGYVRKKVKKKETCVKKLKKSAHKSAKGRK